MRDGGSVHHRSVRLALFACLLVPLGCSGSDFGVANGDVTARSAILWGHTSRTGAVTLEVAKNKRFRGALKRKRLRAHTAGPFKLESHRALVLGTVDILPPR